MEALIDREYYQRRNMAARTDVKSALDLRFGTTRNVLGEVNWDYAVIERLQVNQGGASYNNMLKDCTGTGSQARVDFAAHAQSMGALTFRVSSLAEFDEALAKARAADRTTVIVSAVRASDWTEGGAFWQVGVPEVSERAQVVQARAAMDEGLTAQRRGV